MITPDALTTLTTFTAPGLERALGKQAKGMEFTAARFLGITNGWQFCYDVVYNADDGEGSVKVFLTYNPADGRVTADIG